MRGMAFGPFPACVVRVQKLVQHEPEILILNRFFIRGHPAVPFPCRYPFCNSILDVPRIGNNCDGTAFFQPLQTFNDCGELHAVIGGVRARPEHFPFVFTMAENTSPASSSRIPLTGSVRDQLNVLQATSAQARGSPSS